MSANGQATINDKYGAIFPLKWSTTERHQISYVIKSFSAQLH